jgi:hypothetical protein
MSVEANTARWDNSMVLMKGTEGAKLCQDTSTIVSVPPLTAQRAGLSSR